MATTLINRTVATGGSRDKSTFSCWFKKSQNGSGSSIFASMKDTSNRYMISFESEDTIKIGNRVAGSYDLSYVTTRVFRDCTAWMHIVVAVDTTAGTGDRVKLYVNGVRETVWGESVEPGDGDLMQFNKADGTDYKAYVGGHAPPFDGLMAHVQWIDGTAYAASTFGETDATSGIWKAITSPSVTYGENGFFLKFASGALLTDSSGEGNNFTLEAGTLTETLDNPANNFCTMNALDNYYLDGTFTNGNNTVATGGGKEWGTATTGLSAGLWYYESEIVVNASNSNRIGIAYGPATSSSMGFGDRTGPDYAYYNADGKIYSNGSSTSYGNTWSGTDVILGVYIDLNANKLYFAIDGTIQNSGTGFDITAAASTPSGFYTPAVADDHSSSSATWACNFGNGYFGTDSISSPEADAGGIGAFKYNPSTGTFDGSSKDFRAICTKNIKAYGG